MKHVSEMSLVEILDKNVNQEQLAKDLAAKYVVSYLLQTKADLLNGKIDPVKGTEIDNKAAVAVIDLLLGQIV